MDEKHRDDRDFRARLAKVEDGLRRLGGVYGGLRAIAAALFLVAGVVLFFVAGESDDPRPTPAPPASASRGSEGAATLDEYCERSGRYAATWMEFQSSASRGELRPGALGAAIDNVWSTHAVAPPEVREEYELLAAAVEELDEDLSGDPLADISTFTALFVTNAPVFQATETIDAFDAANCSDGRGA